MQIVGEDHRESSEEEEEEDGEEEEEDDIPKVESAFRSTGHPRRSRSCRRRRWLPVTERNFLLHLLFWIVFNLINPRSLDPSIDWIVFPSLHLFLRNFHVSRFSFDLLLPSQMTSQ